MLFLRLAATAAALGVAASQPTWYGLVPASTGGAVTLVTLSDNAVIDSTMGTIPLAKGEATWPDGFRCIRSFCLFTVSHYPPGNPIPDGSFIYNVSSADARVHSKTPCAGFCRDVHVQYSTGRVFTLSLTQSASIVTEITGGTAVSILDITAALGNSDVLAGCTTHCSEVGPSGHFYVGTSNFGEAPDVIIGVDLAAKKIDSTITLPVLQFAALWAKCDGSGVVGGISYTAGTGAANGTATVGSVDTAGKYTAGDAVSVPFNFNPTGLLTATADGNRFLAAIFPLYTPTNSSGVPGFLWAVQPYGGSDETLTASPYYLIGAAWDKGE
jgi:hypothetical protein